MSEGWAQNPASGALYALTTFASNPASSLVRLDPLTAAPTLIGPSGLPFLVEGDLAFNPVDGMLYGIQDSGVGLLQRNLFRVNVTTGAATVIGSLGSTGDYSALTSTPSGVLYVIDDRPNNDNVANAVLSIVDASNGAVTSSTPLNLQLGSTVGMAIDPATGVAYLADGGGGGASNSLFSLDVAAGTLTSVGPLGETGGAAALAFVNVPEPSAAALLIGGAAAYRLLHRVPWPCHSVVCRTCADPMVLLRLQNPR